MITSNNGHQEIVELLLKGQADPNQSKDRFTALLVASQNGYQGIVALLLKEKADPNSQGEDGETALMLACKSRHQEIVDLKLNEQVVQRKAALILASHMYNGHRKIVELLLKCQADPNIKDQDGVTALMIVSENGCHEIVEHLLKENVKVNETNDDGWTALMFASDHGHVNIAQLLLFAGADPDIETPNGYTVLRGHPSVARLCILHSLESSQRREDSDNTSFYAIETAQETHPRSSSALQIQPLLRSASALELQPFWRSSSVLEIQSHHCRRSSNCSVRSFHSSGSASSLLCR